MEENEPLWEVLITVKRRYRLILDGLSREQAEKLASELHELGHRGVLTQKYYLD